MKLCVKRGNWTKGLLPTQHQRLLNQQKRGRLQTLASSFMSG
jgi:hypothetical protein